ncbi:MAG: fibrillarin-like rRNA/tRNA 2'-O-methyltransferase [Promethearchaeota archaeon]
MNDIEIRPHPKYTNVFISGPMENLRLYTINLVPGFKVYGEKLITHKGVEYREWDPFHSKLAAMILENPLLNIFSENLTCLYLGAASGTTVSHLSDIAINGIIYGVEFAERSIRQLIQNTINRHNVIPILGDANFPESFNNAIFTEIDLIYQDVAQPNQAEIAIKNSDYYLKEKDFIILAIKSQSIDSTIKTSRIYEQEKKLIKNHGLEIIESYNIHKYAANHIMLLIRK